jgi:hypothetical protein
MNAPLSRKIISYIVLNLWMAASALAFISPEEREAKREQEKQRLQERFQWWPTDAQPILEKAVRTLQKNPQADILITGNCDIRGPEGYNLKLGRHRAEAVKSFMLEKGIDESRVRIVSRGKLDAVAPITDLVGMQKDRNAQFMIAEVEEIMLPYVGEVPIAEAKQIEEGKFIVEEEKKIESEIKVSTIEYVIKKGDTLWEIAKNELGSGHRWTYIYELNKDRIKNPNRLKSGQRIILPVE